MDIEEELELYIKFHEDKANYYYDWLDEVKQERKVIGFRYNEVCKQEDKKDL